MLPAEVYKLTEWGHEVIRLMEVYRDGLEYHRKGDQKIFLLLAEEFRVNVHSRGEEFRKGKQEERDDEDKLQEERMVFCEFLKKDPGAVESDSDLRYLFLAAGKSKLESFRWTERRKQKAKAMQPTKIETINLPGLRFDLDSMLDKKTALTTLIGLLNSCLTSLELDVIAHELDEGKPKAFQKVRGISQQSYADAKKRARRKIKASKEIQEFLKLWYL